LGFKVASDWVNAGVWVITNNAALPGGAEWKAEGFIDGGVRVRVGVEHICPKHPQDFQNEAKAKNTRRGLE